MWDVRDPDDVCGICQNNFDGVCGSCKTPKGGDECPLRECSLATNAGKRYVALTRVFKLTKCPSPMVFHERPDRFLCSVFGECTHVFHMHCILKWLDGDAKDLCPMCKRKWGEYPITWL